MIGDSRFGLLLSASRFGAIWQNWRLAIRDSTNSAWSTARILALRKRPRRGAAQRPLRDGSGTVRVSAGQGSPARPPSAHGDRPGGTRGRGLAPVRLRPGGGWVGPGPAAFSSSRVRTMKGNGKQVYDGGGRAATRASLVRLIVDGPGRSGSRVAAIARVRG